MNRSMEIARTLEADIRRRKYAASGKLPSENELCASFSASRGTIRAALQELCRANLIERRNGLGSFLTEHGRRRSGKIGLFIPDHAEFGFFARLADELKSRSESAGYQLQLVTGPNLSERMSPTGIRRLARSLAAARVEGVIFRPCIDPALADANREAARIFRNARTPLVLLDADIAEPPARSDFDIVSVNNVNAARQLAEHLVKRGYRRFAFVADEKLAHWNGNWSNRLFGLAGELALRGLDVGVRTVTLDPNNKSEVCRRLCGRNRPEAVVCANDEIAAALLKTVTALGLRVPADIAVAGFDDLPCARDSSPSLTTVRQPIRQIAEAALKALFLRIRKSNGAAQEICLPTPLLVRQST